MLYVYVHLHLQNWVTNLFLFLESFSRLRLMQIFVFCFMKFYDRHAQLHGISGYPWVGWDQQLCNGYTSKITWVDGKTEAGGYIHFYPHVVITKSVSKWYIVPFKPLHWFFTISKESLTFDIFLQNVNTLTILVMGKGGVGKSSTVNSIIGERAVSVSPFQVLIS